MAIHPLSVSARICRIPEASWGQAEHGLGRDNVRALSVRPIAASGWELTAGGRARSRARLHMVPLDAAVLYGTVRERLRCLIKRDSGRGCCLDH